MTDTRQLLRQGIAAAKAGRREEARQMLLQVIEVDERNELAWIWLSGVVDEPADQRICLENVLDINPDNTHAQKGLAWLNQKHPPVEQPAATGVEREREVNQTVREEPALATTYADPPRREVADGPDVGVYENTWSQEATDTPEARGERFLSYDGKTPLARRPKDPTPLTPTPKTVDEEYNCPYCGAPTTPTQQRCTQCRNDLMIPDNPRERRSFALVVLVGLWALGMVLNIASGVFTLVAVFTATEPVLIEEMMANVLGAVFGILLAVSITRGLWRRRRWAYIVHCIVMSLNVIGLAATVMIALALGGSEFLSGLFVANLINSITIPLEMAIIALWAFIIGFGAIMLLQIILTVFSYRDFYGPKKRFLVDVPRRDGIGHYNAGIAYKDRGMWYMASLEWERATLKNPDDANYRHALGLAYGQLKLYERAQSALQKALSLAPNDRKIKESMALIERRAARKE